MPVPDPVVDAGSPMSNVKRLKRQILQELVQENVDLLHGRPARRVRPRPGRLWTVPRVLAFSLLPIALLGSTRLISSLESRQPPNPVVASVAPPAPAPSVQSVPSVRPVQTVQPPPPATGARVEPPKPIDAAVFPLAVRRVALDPGHGGESLGTHTPLGLMEKNLTLDVALRLRKLLEADHFEVVMTRQDDGDVPLSQRGAAANQGDADIFVSIHVNWIENRQARGVETYYLGPTNDPFLTRLAAAENRESGYSMADMRQLLDRIYANVRQDNSRKLAEVVQASLFSSLRQFNPNLDNRGVKAAPFIVLLTTEMPAILAEVSCLSNDEEAELLSKPHYRQYIAEALAAGVRSYADAVAGAPPEGPQSRKKGT